MAKMWGPSRGVAVEVDSLEFADVEGFTRDVLKKVTDEVPYVRGEA